MKLLGWMLGMFLLIAGIDDIATINRLKKQAEDAYQRGDYTEAVQYYQLLVDSMEVQDEVIRLNLAHAQLQAGDTTTAQQQYSQLMNAGDTDIKSVAYQQLGNITTQQQQYDNALAMYKESLKANPANEDARYNYELVKKLKKEQEQQQQQNQDNNQEQSDEQEKQDQEKSDEQQQDQEGESTDEQNQEQQQSESEQQQDGDPQSEESEPQEQNTQQGEEQTEGEKSDEEMSNSPLSERLEEMNISEEKARMILEAMRNNEMQYIQQNRRKPTKPKDRNKPDW
ncbi:MAG: hypothetical protein AAF632_29330 [Bacteroidota bacterium]